jgi:heat shock protein HslJ
MKKRRLALISALVLLLVLNGCATMSAPPKLENGAWILHTINDELPYGNDAITLSFNSDSQLSGNAGCNDYHANYSHDETTLNIDTISTTRKMCTPEAMQQERRYLQLLGEAATFQDKCNWLRIHTQGNDLLMFKRK